MPDYTITAVEYVEIDGVPLSTPAWSTANADDLWASPEVRGGDVLIPGATGVLPQPRRWTVSKATIELHIVGDTDWDGEPYTDLAAGLAMNCDHLRALADPPDTADGTRTLVLHLPTGMGTRSAPVHVLRARFTRGAARNFAVGQLELSLPTGHLATDVESL